MEGKAQYTDSFVCRVSEGSPRGFCRRRGGVHRLLTGVSVLLGREGRHRLVGTLLASVSLSLGHSNILSPGGVFFFKKGHSTQLPRVKLHTDSAHEQKTDSQPPSRKVSMKPCVQARELGSILKGSPVPKWGSKKNILLLFQECCQAGGCRMFVF